MVKQSYWAWRKIYINIGYVLRESFVHINEDYPTLSEGKTETDSAYLLPPIKTQSLSRTSARKQLLNVI